MKIVHNWKLIMLYLNAISFVSFKPSVNVIFRNVIWEYRGFASRGGSWMLLVSILNFFQDSVCICNKCKMMREIIVVSRLCQLLLYGFDFINENFVLIYTSGDCCLPQWTPLNMQCTCRSGLAWYSHNEMWTLTKVFVLHFISRRRISSKRCLRKQWLA